jgi:cytochrome P450
VPRRDQPEGSATMLDTLSFTDEAVKRCPFPAYDQLREERPVHRDPITGHYILTRYDDVRRALLNVRALSNRAGLMGDRWSDAANRLFASEGWLPMNTLVSNDPPEHRFYRQLVEKAFTPAKVANIEPRVQELVDELIEAMADKDEVDFLNDFAVPLPMYVIAEQLGVAASDRAAFKTWSDVALESMNPDLSDERQLELAKVLIEMQQYMARQIARVRSEPDDKLLSRLVAAESNGRRLNDQELQSLLLQILVAGNETTTTTLASGMRIMIEQPDVAEAIRLDPSRARTLAEETLRTATPLQALFRKALSDVEIDGIIIPEGSIVEVRFGSANRDPQQFACPASVDLDRRNAASHLAFGSGIHLCIGNQLARAELRLAFATLAQRLTDFRATRGEDSYVAMDGYMTFGLRELWMAFDRR